MSGNGSAAASVEGFRLSPAQWRLWTRQTEGRVFVSRARMQIDGEFDERRLSASLAALAQRHDLLRATFRQLPGMRAPLLVIERDVRPELYTVEADDDNASASFPPPATWNWERGPLIDIRMVRSGPKTRVLQMQAPAMIADPHSLKLLLLELVQFAHGAPPAPPEEVQFLHFADWCHECRDGDEGPAGLAYWSRTISELPARVTLPFEGAARTGRHARIDLVVPKIDPSRLLACWCAVLGHRGGARGVTVHHRMAGRLFTELQTAVGPMAEFLPLGITWTDDEPFSSFVERLGTTTSEAAERTPFFEGYAQAGGAQFGFDHDAVDPPLDHVAAGMPLAIEAESDLDDFDILLRGTNLGLETHLALKYDEGRHDAQSMRWLVDALAATIAQAADPTPMRRIARLGRDEMATVTHEWNLRAVRPPDPSSSASLPAAFARTAAAQPQAEAVRFADASGDVQCLTYAALDARSNQLAHLLQRLGVAVEDRVALIMPRGVDAIAAIVGVWKAGATYVPLDPDNPPRRQSALLEAAAATVVITHPELTRRDWAGGRRVVDLTDETLAGLPDTPCDAIIAPRHAAYIIFTSGSTGTPKGVIVEHRSALNLARALEDAVYSTAADGRWPVRRVSVNAPLSFDASVKQIIQLLAGRCLCIVPDDARQDPEQLLAWIARERIDVLDGTPSHFRLLVNAGLDTSPQAAPALILVGGEPIDPDLWRRLASLRQARAFNVYGPTETTVNAAVEPIVEAAAPTIGRPIQNARLYILDDDLQPVPIGVSGELCIGGLGLARGYASAAEPTASRFVPDPYGLEPGGRMYRSGDAARFLADGRIEFLGRIDAQVKVRGFRVEPGEIEATLREHPDVSDAAVIAPEDRDGVRRLVGYVTLRRDAGDAAAFTSGLAQFNKHETEYLYEEIFVRETYLQEGISLPDHAIVFDVGANIGMFALFAARRSRGARIFSFEPVASIYDKLAANLDRHVPGARHFPFGLSDREQTGTFTVYPGYSMMSGQQAYADAAAELTTIKTYLRNQQAAGSTDAATLLEHADELLGARFEGEAVTVPLRRLSDVMRAESVERIDLLKIDVQRAEMDVLLGIDEEDWPRIKQIVLEVHDAAGTPTEGRLGVLMDMLERRGYVVHAAQDPLLSGTDRYTAYAVRPEYQRAPGDAATAVPSRPVAAAAAPGPTFARSHGGGEAISISALREFLDERLPDYMIPSAFVVLPALPLTRHGKVDRAALPAPELSHRAAAGEEQEPENWQEQALIEIWREVLRVDRVGVTDNFFELGGDSIRSIQVQAAAQRRGLRFPLQSLFAKQTIRALVRSADVTHIGGGDVSRSRAFDLISPADRARLPEDVEDAYPLSALQAGMIYHTEMTEEGSTYHNVTTHRVRGRLDPARLQAAVDELIAAHPMLRTSFHLWAYSEPLALVSRRVSCPVALTDLRGLTTSQQDARIDEDVANELRRPFQWDQAPLLRLAAYRVDEDAFQLMVSEYHAILDGWSLHLLLAEICGRYARQLGHDAVGVLDPPRLSYRRFIDLENQVRASSDAQDFWRRTLAGASRASLPRAPLAVRNGPRKTLEHRVDLPVDLFDALRLVSARAGVPVKSLLVAVHAAVIGRTCGVDDVVTGLVVNGRPEEPDGDRVIGLFINTVPLRLSIAGTTWIDLARQAFTAETALMPYRRFPLADVQRMIGGAPLFESFFNFSQFHALPAQAGEQPVAIVGSRHTPADIDFPLAVDIEMAPAGDRGQLLIQYDARKLTRAGVVRLGESYWRALQALAAAPDASLDDVALVADDAPRTPLEQEIARIWCNVLGRTSIGRDEEFVEAGGHSLLATRVVLRVRQQFGCDLPLSAFCSHSSIAALATWVANRQGESTAIDDAPLCARGARS